MATNIYVPISPDVTPNFATWIGKTSPYWPALSDGSDSTYWDDSAGLNYQWTLGPKTGSVAATGTVTAASATLKCNTDANDGSTFSVTIFESNGTTAMTNAVTITPTSFGGSPTFSNVTGAAFTLTAAGQIASNWVNCQIGVSDGGSGSGDWRVSELSVSVTDSSGGGGGGTPMPAALLGMLLLGILFEEGMC